MLPIHTSAASFLVCNNGIASCYHVAALLTWSKDIVMKALGPGSAFVSRENLFTKLSALRRRSHRCSTKTALFPPLSSEMCAHQGCDSFR